MKMSNPVASTTTTTSFVPTPPILDLTNRFQLATTWRTWIQRWKAFAAITKLSSEQEDYQTGMFIASVGDETLRIINALPYDTEEDRGKLTTILQLLETFCLESENVVYGRHKFYQRCQKDEEPVEDFITALRTLAQTCQFSEEGKDFSEQMIRDGLVCGILNDNI